MLTYMQIRRTTLILPEHLDASLRQEAARRGITVSALTREAIARHLGVPGADESSSEAGLDRPRRRLSFTGAGTSDRTDISERIEELLREDFGSET